MSSDLEKNPIGVASRIILINDKVLIAKKHLLSLIKKDQNSISGLFFSNNSDTVESLNCCFSKDSIIENNPTRVTNK